MPRTPGLNLKGQYLPCVRGFNYALGYKTDRDTVNHVKKVKREDVADTPKGIDNVTEVTATEFTAMDTQFSFEF